MATIGGTLAVGEPTGPVNLALLALGAEVTIRMPAARTAPLHVLFADRSTYLPPHALMTEIALPQLPANPGTAYAAVSRTPHDHPIVNAAALVTRVGHICHHARLALGGVAPCPLRVPGVESLLLGHEIDEPLLARVANAITEAVDPRTDSRASADYRREMAAVVAVRALRRAWEQTGRSPV
jgi:carbon-monoxide dehydrogenase medium subunit